MKSKKIVIVVFVLLILVGGFIGYKTAKKYRSSNILMSLYNDRHVKEDETYFINGKEVSSDEADNSNSYAYVYKFKSRNYYPKVEDSIGTSVGEVLKIDNYHIQISFGESVTCNNLIKCIANGRHESSIRVAVSKDNDRIKLSKEDYQKTFNYMWNELKKDYFNLLINYIARSYNYPYSYDNFGFFRNFTIHLWNNDINYESIKLSEEEILKVVNG